MRTFPTESRLEEADIALLGVPWDSTETGKSVKHGPLFIREALKTLPGLETSTGRNIYDQLKFCDLGDVEVVPGNWKLTSDRILDTMRFLHTTKTFPILLGGDHLITLAALESLPEPVTVVHFDAHRDLAPEWMGEPFSHITWGYHALKKGHRLAQVGVRSWTAEETQVAEQFNAQLLDLSQVSGNVWITVDLDVFDPGVAPDVGTPEPAGMQPREFFPLLKQVCGHQLVGMDIVECASTQINTPTALLGAQIIKKVLAWKV